MSNSTIIELRQLEADNVERNGFYRSRLNNPVLLEEGDQVNIKAVYLDTSESAAGLIHLEKDVNVEMEMALYIQNYNLDQTFLNNAGVLTDLREYPNLPVNNQRMPFELGDNAIWWLGEASENTSAFSWSVTKFNIGLVPGNNKDFGGCNIAFEYQPTTPGSSKVTKTISIKKHRRKLIDVLNPFELNIVCAGTGAGPTLTVISEPSFLKEHQIGSIDFTPFQTQLSSGETIMNLQTFPISFTISAGDYTPSQMAAVISDNLSNIEHDGPVDALYEAASAASPNTKTNYPAMSPFLTTILKNDRKLQLQATATSSTIQQVFINGTDYISTTTGNDLSGTYYMNYNITDMKADFVAVQPGPFNPPLDKYVGANQVSMVFDENEQKLKWDSLHFPIYVNESDPSATPPSNDATHGLIYNSIENNFPEAVVIPTGMPIRYGGVAFTKLEPQNFWEKQLGFSTCIITPNQTAKLNYPLNTSTPPAHANSFVISAKDGQHITGAYPGLDVGVIKSETTYSTPPFMDLSQNPAPTIDISTPDTWGIFGDRSFNNSVADEGYFLVDVSPGIRQNLVGANGSSNSTQSIVNRYYTQNSFTSDQGAGSVTYTHTGTSELLSDFQIRVLNPDKSPVNETILNDKNTIFIEIIKPIKEEKTN